MELLAKYNVQTTFYFPVLKRFAMDLAVSADWTPATGDTKISKDGGNFANTSNNPAAIGGTGSAGWSLTLTATELSAARVMVQVVDAATKAVEDQVLIIATYGNASAAYAFDLGTASSAQTGDSYARLGAPAGASVSADVAAIQADTDNLQTRVPTALVSGRMDSSVGAMASGVLTATAIAADAITAAKVADGTIDAATFAAGAIDAAAIATDAIGSAELAASAVTEIQSGLATSAALATVQADTDDIQTRLPSALVGGKMDSHVNDIAASAITATSIATDAITAAKIAADAIGASELAADAVTEIQSGLATSSAVAGVQSDTDDIQARLPAALVGGRIDASVGAMAADVVTAAAIATDAIGSAELAASAVTEIQAGLATAAAVTSVQADTDDIQTRLPAALVGGRMDSSVGAMAAGVVTAAAVATDAIDADALATDAVNEIADGVLTRALSAVEGSAPVRSLAWAIAKLTNKVSLSGGTLSIKKTDDSTDLFTQAVATDAGQAPVVSVDTN